MLPLILRRIGQRKKLIQPTVGDRFRLQPGTRDPAKLQLSPHNQAREADATHGRTKPFWQQRRSALDRFPVGTCKPEPAHMVAERTQPVVILAMHVVGDGSADCNQLRARRHGQQPTVGDRQPLDIAQQHARFAANHPAFAVIRHQMIQPPREPERSARIQARIAIAAPHPERDARLRIA